ncbi:hypothetical protein [Flavobacterium subsaxonicum]|uniref:Lipoprotein n=1 Tax=Flavobacterium subsaxonicum WB 4.1-42 = DSM 21790 TaxID=1121898 RepID=A0A0A2MFN0_9FLAO|nr:hypothetical protein [Flavobacterium subsaxonicum]KGO91084.1 hypothetical protein Q766_19980 [Flavobacterium subsaxonicum WB 4.1-42 = DSM 21790]
MKRYLIIVSILLFLILQACSKSESNSLIEKYALSIEDSIQIEKELLNYKKCLFSEVYNRSREANYKRMHLEMDTVKDLTYYFHSTFNIRWFYEDKNRSKLLKNWLDKEVYIPIAMPPDHPDGSLDLARAIDFYESEELQKYIDSLRISEYNFMHNEEKE